MKNASTPYLIAMVSLTIAFAVFGVIVYFTKYVSLGSVLSISISPIIMLALKNYKGVLVTLFLALSVTYTHRENIKRLLNGTERKIGEKK